MNQRIHALCRVAFFAAVFATGCQPAPAPGRLAHFYYVNEPLSLESLQANYSRMTLVSATWFTVDATGALEFSIDAAVAEWAGQRGIDLMPIVVNRGFRPEVVKTVLESEEQTSKLITTLTEIAARKRFAGLQLDFENVPREMRSEYAAFAERLARALRNRAMRFAVAVPAPLAPAGPPQQEPASWKSSESSAGFDYRRLGEASDFVTVMTYDEYVSPDQPGPIAGLTWVEACVGKMIEFVPADKVSLGIPLYHRRWSGKKISDGPYADAQALATRWKAALSLHPVHYEAYFQYSDSGLEHVVWLYDARSVAKRLSLVGMYGLAGFSAWRLGQEDPGVWKSVFPRQGRKRK